MSQVRDEDEGGVGAARPVRTLGSLSPEELAEKMDDMDARPLRTDTGITLPAEITALIAVPIAALSAKRMAGR